MRPSIVLLVALVLGACKSESKGAKVEAEAQIANVPTGATPEEAFKNYQQALGKRDLHFLWSFVSDRDKKGDIGDKLALMNGNNVPAARIKEFAAGYHMSEDEVRKLSKPDFDRHFLGMLLEPAADLIQHQTIAKVTVSGDTAILELEAPASKLALVNEGGQWHFDMGGTSAANGH